MATTLVEPLALRAHLQDPRWVSIDCRFDLARPEWGAHAFAAGHIPGALYADLDRDLSGPRTSFSGRHPLPEPGLLAATLSRFGIDAEVQVVAYDQGPGSFAARLWWLLRWLGHAAAAVLDGGYEAWRAAGGRVSSAPAMPAARVFVARPREAAYVSADEVAALLARHACLLLDARSAERYEGR
ncbi:MAG TPA: rhodanese-like domain-containing protein, partial [Steroidobacteraceae bacterium]|nr:rhodanese-like domain-containing protein [Steroidobacteraceae bacterium]